MSLIDCAAPSAAKMISVQCPERQSPRPCAFRAMLCKPKSQASELDTSGLLQSAALRVSHPVNIRSYYEQPLREYQELLRASREYQALHM